MPSGSGPKRARVPDDVEARVLMRSGRRCCLCWHYDSDFKQKLGQIAHLDQDPSNAEEDNLAFLCIPHHSEYDSITRQHKNYTKREVRELRDELYQTYAGLEATLKTSVRWHFSIEGSVRECNKDVVGIIANRLQYFLNDPLIRVERIEPGSIVIHCRGSAESFLRLTPLAKTDEFASRVGKVISLPEITQESILRFTQELYSALQNIIRDASKSAMAVEDFLTENNLLSPLAEAVSAHVLDSISEQLRTTIILEQGKRAWQAVGRFPVHLRVILMMSVLGWDVERAQEYLHLRDRRQVAVYLTLGASAWGDAQAQKVMSAGGSPSC